MKSLLGQQPARQSKSFKTGTCWAYDSVKVIFEGVMQENNKRCDSTRSTYSNQCKQVVMKFYDLYLLTERSEREFSYLSVTQNFHESLKFSQIT